MTSVCAWTGLASALLCGSAAAAMDARDGEAQVGASPPATSAAAAATDPRLPLEAFSPSFLGIYRKVMKIEDEIRRFTDRYDVDYDLARAVCLYESGGNAGLRSWVGAEGYFQVMPSTFRSLRVRTNIEAGVKYLGQLVKRFNREDYAIAGYNGGPGRVARRRPMPLESLQYVLGVGYYRDLLRMLEPSIRYHATRLQLAVVGEQDDWWRLSERLGLSILQLRLHNPFLANRQLRVGQLIAYPPEPRTDLLTPAGDDLEYRTRHGDNYFNIAFTLDVDLDTLREANGLWRLQTLPVGMRLRLPLAWTAKHTMHTVQAGETLPAIAEQLKSDPWRIIRDNRLWDQEIHAGMILRVRQAPPKPTYLIHRVSRGENLGLIARRYRTTVGAIQRANRLGRRTLIRIGQRLRIPTTSE